MAHRLGDGRYLVSGEWRRIDRRIVVEACGWWRQHLEFHEGRLPSEAVRVTGPNGRSSSMPDAEF